MSSDDKPKSDDEKLIRFPVSRTKPAASKKGFKDLGSSKFSQKIGGVQPNLKGHWCGRCKGIWFGYVGECECPVCGNRNG
jgi:hypothetical protein